MNTALVIIDMQKGFVNENTSGLSDKIVDFANSGKFNLVIGTRYVNNKNTACHIYERWDACWEGSEESELIGSINSVCDVVLSKSTFSCWNDAFKKVLRYFSIDRLVFCGVNTSCCVLASAFGAYDDVWDITVIEDLCGSTTGVDSHENGIRVLKECITKSRVMLADDYKKGVE